MRYHLTGTLSPDATSNYLREPALYNGKESWARETPGYYLWWDGIDTWTISTELGTPGTAYWTRQDPNPVGLYSPQGTATGDATLALGFHTLNVTGVLTPDATCNYPYGGLHNTRPYWRRQDGLFHIWWSVQSSAWFISELLGTPGSQFWSRQDPSPLGDYDPTVATGTATVAVGEHT